MWLVGFWKGCFEKDDTTGPWMKEAEVCQPKKLAGLFIYQFIFTVDVDSRLGRG